MEKKILIVFAFLIFSLGVLAGKFLFDFQGNVTGKVISEEVNENNSYSWTTAICNENKECVDVTIKCDKGNVVSIVPASELKSFNESWSDPRKEFTEYCK